MTFRYLTPERMKMHLWTRKRRLKFRKRWRRQHGGCDFHWFKSEYRHAFIDPATPGADRMVTMYFHQRPVSVLIPS